jgi:hypothetical protein
MLKGGRGNEKENQTAVTPIQEIGKEILSG